MGAVETLKDVPVRVPLLPDDIQTLGFSLLDLMESRNVVSSVSMQLTPLSASFPPPQPPPNRTHPHPLYLINAPISVLNLEFLKLDLCLVPPTGDDGVRRDGAMNSWKFSTVFF